MSAPGTGALPADHELRPATLDDAEAYVSCHVECLAETYAAIMPPAFAEQRRAAVAQTVAETRAAWVAWSEEDEAQRTRAWIALDADGEAVGVARSGPGPQPWEVDMGAPTTEVGFELHHIYTRRRTHGTGLGQALLERAVGQHDAYLWILHGNPRAASFYRRNGFSADGAEMSCGPSWFHRPMFRMTRLRPGSPPPSVLPHGSAEAIFPALSPSTSPAPGHG